MTEVMVDIFQNKELVELLSSDNSNDKRIDEMLVEILRKHYTDERIPNVSYGCKPNKFDNGNDLPEPLKAARDEAIPGDKEHLNRTEIFLKQAQMLENYEDDFDCRIQRVHYYPTYQSLNNRELRAYFSWRTKWRKGIREETSLSYAFLYVYELLHLIGCKDAEDAYSKLDEFSKDYAHFDPYINVYLKKWIKDFTAYYRLDPSLLANTEEARNHKAIYVLLNIEKYNDEDIFQAVSKIAGVTLTGSRLTKKHPDMMKFLVAETLRQVAVHYSKKCQNSWADHYLGFPIRIRMKLFDKAVFHRQESTEDCEIEFSPLHRYECSKGIWYSYEFRHYPEHRKRLSELLRTIDAMARKSIGFPYLIQQKVKTKWLMQVIQEEIQQWNAKQIAAQRKEVRIDLSKLGDIRSSSDVTREKLLTEEEKFDSAQCIDAKPKNNSETDGGENTNDSKCSPSNDDGGFASLSANEKRYLKCLLEGSSVSWVSGEGLLPSLLCDSINDKLYDIFEDTVLEDGAVVEDYRDQLRKGICA